MADDSTLDGVRPDSVYPDSRASFLPVTKAGWLACFFLISVVIVALTHAVQDLDGLREALAHRNVVYEAVQEDNDDDGSVDAEKVTGDDGREYYRVPGLADGDSVSSEKPVRAMARRVGDPTRTLEERERRQQSEIHRGIRAFHASVLEGLPGSDGEEGVIRNGADDGVQVDSGLRSSFREGIEQEVCELLPGCEKAVHAVGQAGVYRLGSSVGGGLRFDGSWKDLATTARNPFTAFGQWAGSKFMASPVGRKLMSSAAASTVAAIVSFGALTGGYYVADEMMAERSAAMQESYAAYIERVTPEMTTAIESVVADGATVTTADVSVAMLETGMSAASRGVALTEEEFIAETASNYLTMQRGQSGEFVTDAFLSNLAEGMISCDELPFLAAFGNNLAELCGYDLSDDVNWFPDTDDFSGSGGGESGLNPYDYDSSLIVYGRFVQRTVNGEFITQEVTQYTHFWIAADSGKKTLFYSTVNPSTGKLNRPGSQVFASETAQGNGLYSFTLGPNAVFLGDFSPNAKSYSSFTVEDVSNAQTAGQMAGGLEQAISSFFDAGGQLVGNDAQFGDNGELIDSGTANIANALYNDSYNPDTWNQVLYDAGVNAVEPAGQTVNASDEVIGGNQTGETIYDAVGANTANPPPKSVPQLQFATDLHMGELSDVVGHKFPFSIVYNVSHAFDSLKATPEAPHFTWVFALPTGTETLEINLSQFSPVAEVLRLTLDVLFVFTVITILAKIAQLFGFVAKQGD